MYSILSIIWNAVSECSSVLFYLGLHLCSWPRELLSKMWTTTVYLHRSKGCGKHSRGMLNKFEVFDPLVVVGWPFLYCLLRFQVGEKFVPPNEKCISYNCTKDNEKFVLMAITASCPAFNKDNCLPVSLSIWYALPKAFYSW